VNCPTGTGKGKVVPMLNEVPCHEDISTA